MEKMEEINEYVNIEGVDNLQDYLQSNNCIITQIKKIILDVRSDKMKKKLYKNVYDYDYDYDYEYDNDMNTSELQGHIMNYLSDETGYLILECEIMIKKTQRNIRNEKITLLVI